MSSFKIEGGHSLKGEITPQGAKNEALQVICSVLLTSEKVTLSNVPDILDVNRLISILQDIGVEVKKNKPGEYLFQANKIDENYLLTCGEDYQLIFTAKKNNFKKITSIAKSYSVKVTKIGSITKKKKLVILNKNNNELRFKNLGFKHF